MPTITETTPITASDWAERIEPRIVVTDDGCWEWQGPKLPAGYGYVTIRGRKHYTHRLAHEVWTGPIPDGLHIDHLCRNRTCCNPAHLEAVTQRVNTLRSENFAAHRHRQTHCVHGHAFDDANTYTAPNGTRKCRACRTRVREESRKRLALAA